MENIGTKGGRGNSKLKRGASPKKNAKVIDIKLQRKKLAGKISAKQSAAKLTNKDRRSVTTKSTQPSTKGSVTERALRSAPNSSKVAEGGTETPEQRPAFLLTPSPEMLKSFRRAGERSRAQAKKLERLRANRSGFLAKPAKGGKRYTLDLRIHSPGTDGYFSTGGVEAGEAIVRLARAKGLDIIGITDCLNATFVDYIKDIAAKSKVSAIPGFDLRCVVGNCREVYMVALFPEGTTSADIFSTLDELGVPEEFRGKKDYVLELPLSSIITIVERRGGVLIPSRLDKTPYRQLALSALIEDYGFHAFDVVHPENTEFFRERWPAGGFTFLSFSNANALAQIGSRVAKVKLASPGFAGIKQLVARRECPSAS